MDTVPNTAIVEAAITALKPFHPDDAEQAENMLMFWVRRSELTPADIFAVLEQMFPEAAACPEWCLLDHAEDDQRDDLVLHQGDDHTDGTVRKLLDAHALSIRVSRTDCPSEGRTGTPALLVRADLELTTWEQAGELARAILDSFGYLQGAEQ